MELTVNASKKYKIIIESEIDGIANYLELFKGKILIITDKRVNYLYGDILDKILANKEVYKYEILQGEDSKNAKNYLDILNYLAENNFHRNDTIVALGGGVVGDLAGFVASTYMRGISLIMIPTTLLSMVDSSVGGKNAINLESGKNLVGTFYQPSLVYIATNFLQTLPNREILSGMGEVIKYAFILGIVTYEDLQKGITKELIYKCLQIKSQIVEEDEKEGGKRKLLNLGHTIGHAIEKASDYTISHGECVIKGLQFSLEISKKLGELNEENYKKAIRILTITDADVTCLYTKDQLFTYIKNDKKSGGEYIDFIVVDNNLLSQIKRIKVKELYHLI